MISYLDPLLSISQAAVKVSAMVAVSPEAGGPFQVPVVVSFHFLTVVELLVAGFFQASKRV